MKTRTALFALLAGSLATVAAAQPAGSYVFTSDDDNVYHLPSPGGAANSIATFSGDHRLLGIAVGGNNRLFVGNGPIPVQQPVNTTTMMYTVDNWFGGPAVISPLQNGDPIQNPNHHIFHGPYQGLVTVNNPGTQEPLPNRSEGIYHINGNNGATTLMLQEQPLGTPAPYYNAGGAVTARQGVANTFFVTAVEGSATQSLGHSSRASSLHRLDVNPATLAATESLVIDLGNTAQTGLAFPISRANGIASVGNSLFLTSFEFSTNTGRIIQVDLNPAGGVAGVSVLLDNLAFVNDIVFNPTNGRLAFTDRGADPGIWEVNPDGTGLTKILDGGPLPERLAVLPAPSALALLGVGTLVAARRRR
jgi:hypothetical protein